MISAGNEDGLGGVTASYLPPAEAARPVVDSGILTVLIRLYRGEERVWWNSCVYTQVKKPDINRNTLSRMMSPAVNARISAAERMFRFCVISPLHLVDYIRKSDLTRTSSPPRRLWRRVFTPDLFQAKPLS